MKIEARFTTVPGTQAAEGRTGEHAVVVDRPLGVAGGRGLGLNGGQLLALAIGGCLSNDVRYVAAHQSVEVDDVAVDVSVEIEDARVASASVTIGVMAAPGVDTAVLVNWAVEVSTVLAAVRSGFPVDVTLNP